MACATSVRDDRGVWFQRDLPTSRHLEAVIELLAGLGRMLMEIDDKLDQIVELLEEER